MCLDICYDPDPKTSMLQYSGGLLDVAAFLSIVELNPEMRKYEFGITGMPTSIMVIFIENKVALGFIGSYKLLESLRGLHADQMREIIRALA
jgi:hypothetical protein